MSALPILRILSLLLGCMLVTQSASLYAQEAAALYATYCAGCHGSRLDGGSGGALIKTEWNYGRGRNHLIRNITYGIADTEMAAWNRVLDRDQIANLATYIEESQRTPLSARRPLPEQIETADYTLQVEQLVVEGIDSPWGIAFLDSDTALVTERGGGIRRLVQGHLDPVAIQGVPRPLQTRIGGLMGIVVDPNYAENGWIYLAMSHTTGDADDASEPAMTRILRGRIKEDTWTDQEILFQVTDTEQVADGHRWGGTLLFDREGYLYFTIGDMAQGESAQDLSKATGKTFRIHPDGTIPEDNPFVGVAGAMPAIFTVGNRNTQGLAQHPETDALWSTDHGPMGGDEVNILVPGGNYGWPEVTYGIDYSGEVVSERTEDPAFISPILQWTPSIAVSPAAFVTEDHFPAWKHHLMVGALAYEELRRLVVGQGTILEQETILKGYGRVRDVEEGPDGALYVLLNNPDKIIRLSPR